MLPKYLRTILDLRSRARRAEDVTALYLELMKSCLTNSIYDDDLDLRTGVKTLDPASGKYVCVAGVAVGQQAKYLGHMWPSRAHTMIGIPRLNNLQQCVESVIAQGVAGDLIEAGVWRGGAAIFARALLKAYGVTDRTVWVADSFEGLPEADAIKHPYDHELDLHVMAALAVSLDEVKKNFERYSLLDGQVKFLKGWFRDSLPAAPIERLAVLRVDGDHYESTMDVLRNLYPKVTDGGYVIIDDYRSVKGCDLAVEHFRRQHAITEELHLIPGGGGAYWRRGR